MTDNVEETREKLAAAIKDHLLAMGMMEEDIHMLNNWCVVADIQKVEEDGFGRYAVACHHQNTPPHVAIGLFYQGIHIINDHRD